eukprot:SAG31_NODE_16899_length_691_cov_0.812500_1_plen_124_part_01
MDAYLRQLLKSEFNGWRAHHNECIQHRLVQEQRADEQHGKAILLRVLNLGWKEYVNRERRITEQKSIHARAHHQRWKLKSALAEWKCGMRRIQVAKAMFFAGIARAKGAVMAKRKAALAKIVVA